MCEERASLGSRNENQVFMFQVQEGHSRFDFFAQTRDRRDIVGGQMSRDDEGSGGHKGVATQKVFFFEKSRQRRCGGHHQRARE